MVDPQTPKTRIASVVQDPSAQAVARVYADAFLDAAASVGVQDALEEFASFLDDVLALHPDFESLLTGILGRDDKIAIINRVVEPLGSELFTNFLRVLARHERLDLLWLILNESRHKHEVRTGRERVQVTSAKTLSGEHLEKIRQCLDEALPFEPILETNVDPSLLGGLVIRVGDTVYDSSLRTRMKQLRQRLRQRSLHEIQSGRDRFSHPEGD